MISANLRKNLKDKNPARRRKALFALRSNSIEIFKKVIVSDSSPVIRHEAAFLLGRSKNKEAVDILIQAIKTDTSDLVRHEAIEALGDSGINNTKVKVLLQSLMKDKNPFIRDTARIALLTLELFRK